MYSVSDGSSALELAEALEVLADASEDVLADAADEVLPDVADELATLSDAADALELAVLPDAADETLPDGPLQATRPNANANMQTTITIARDFFMMNTFP